MSFGQVYWMPLVVAGLLLLLAFAGTTSTYAATADLLPDLGLAPFDNFFIIDTTTLPGHNLMRFTSRIVNNGVGPFEIHGARPSTNQRTMRLRQTIYKANGKTRTVGVPFDPSKNCGTIPAAGVTPSTKGTCLYWAGDGHNHWHVYALAQYNLISVDSGQTVARAAKIGFCFNDDWQWNLSLPSAPQTAVYGPPPKITCAGGDPSALKVMEGLSVGWGDTYGWQVYWQWVDVTGLPAGTYRLEGHVDPNHWFKEMSTANNCNYAILQIQGGGSSVSVQQLSPGMQPC